MNALQIVLAGLALVAALTTTGCMGMALRHIEKGTGGSYSELKKLMTPPPPGSGRLFVYVFDGGPSILNTMGLFSACTVNEHIYMILGATCWYLDLPAGTYMVTAGGASRWFSGRYGKNRVDFDLKEGETTY